MIFERVGERGRASVITGPRDSFGIFFVGGFAFGEPRGIEPDLMFVAEHAHQRIGKSAGETAERLKGDGNCDRGLDDEIAVAFTGKIENRSLARKESGFWRRDHCGETSATPGFDALIGKAGFVGGTAPRRAGGAGFRPLSDFARAPWGAFGRRRSRRGANIGESIDAAGINRQTFAF